MSRVDVDGDRRPAGRWTPPATTRWCGALAAAHERGHGRAGRLGGVPGATDGTILTRDAGLATRGLRPGRQVDRPPGRRVRRGRRHRALRRGLRRGRPALPDRGAPHDTVVRPRAGQRPHRRAPAPGRATTTASATAGSPARPWCWPGRRRRRRRRRRAAAARAPARPTCSTRATWSSGSTRSCLTGGSAYGLAAADGVMHWLADHGVGFPVGGSPDEVVPIVPAAVLFDLGRGGDFANRPDATFGAAACRRRGGDRRRGRAQGCVGAGTGASAAAQGRHRLGQRRARRTAPRSARWSWSTPAGRPSTPRPASCTPSRSACPASSRAGSGRRPRTCARARPGGR